MTDYSPRNLPLTGIHSKFISTMWHSFLCVRRSDVILLIRIGIGINQPKYLHCSQLETEARTGEVESRRNVYNLSSRGVVMFRLTLMYVLHATMFPNFSIILL
ncbi:hypothetical protein PHLGIDRAFT_221877 [Phlebiopsis gigantea 11061_1 CR5-6]|uniref:Uncharacterized protein n=1 Tax=Phlebiopsis gigantea (strain 11061_1 CR5-6) TaxID=745531 RepID=A0A0C3S2J1_PHLG1|nr:hypothetical protein PHLGIDRAFT_221877 [Phlebiopsis gigantea 11061_1 CR5-6]